MVLRKRFLGFIPDWDKRRLALGNRRTRFESRSLPLGAIYVLGERRPDPAPFVEAMRPQDALLSLVADTYANKILDREMRAREFALLGQLVTTVPIRRVHPHEDPARLEELCKVIREDLRSLDIPAPLSPKYAVGTSPNSALEARGLSVTIQWNSRFRTSLSELGHYVSCRRNEFSLSKKLRINSIRKVRLCSELEPMEKWGNVEGESRSGAL